ncbi:MAG: hypothetical protein Q9182_005317 [Xanthomendoza sp. 2 TL-2023]
MSSIIAVLVTLIAPIMAQSATPQPSTTPALQSFLSVSNLDASQAAKVSSQFRDDLNSYYAGLPTEPAYAALSDPSMTVIPASARALEAADPELFLASLALAKSKDRPSWFSALPTPAQAAMISIGSRDIELYTSEVVAVRPISAIVASSLSSFASSQSTAAAATASKAVQKGAAPESPVTSGRMGVIAVGVALAAGLVGIALL